VSETLYNGKLFYIYFKVILNKKLYSLQKLDMLNIQMISLEKQLGKDLTYLFSPSKQYLKQVFVVNNLMTLSAY